MSIRITFMGAVRTVTGSRHFISNGNAQILVDCGLFQGRRDESFEVNSSFSFEPEAVDALVLSHAHIDHSGNIPTLVKRGFTGKILATLATADLCSAMLPDSGHIQEEDIKFVNKINKRKNLPPRKPLYNSEDAEESLQYFSGRPYREAIGAAEGFSVTFYDAGHVLGSAVPLIEVDGGGKKLRIAYAVDLGRKSIPILKDPELPPDIDYMFIESTYGGRLHSSTDEAKGMLEKIVNETIERGGNIIIPSFALERTQEVVYHLKELLDEDRIPDIPIYVDSPLAVNITDIFLRHPECFDAKMLEAMQNHEDPLGCRRIEYIKDVEKSKALNKDSRAKVIISASGMCEAGRILHHLRNNIENPRNTVLVVGYMAENTLGRRIVEREETVKIFGQEHPLRAQVSVINAFSAHADRSEILEYMAPLKGKLKKAFIVHGEEEQSEKLLEALKEQGFPAHIPVPGEEIELP